MIQFIKQRDLGLSIAFFAIAIDQISKHFILNTTMEMPKEIIPSLLSITLAWNPGMSFSFMANFSFAKELLSIIAIVASIVFIVLMRQPAAPNIKLHQTSLGFIVGGAIGNVIDRFIHGAVIDFFHLHWHETTLFIFNGADAFISLGVALLLLESLFLKKNKYGYYN